LLESQLEAYENSSAIWGDVGNLIWGAADAYTSGTPLDQTEWAKLLASSENWEYQNPYELEKTKTELTSIFSGILETGGYLTSDDLGTTNESIDGIVTYFTSNSPLPVTTEGTQSGYDNPEETELKNQYLEKAQKAINDGKITSIADNKKVSDIYGEYLKGAHTAGVGTISYDDFVANLTAWSGPSAPETQSDEEFDSYVLKAKKYLGDKLNSVSEQELKSSSEISSMYNEYYKAKNYSSSAKSYDEFVKAILKKYSSGKTATTPIGGTGGLPRNLYRTFKTGGLASFTGPAWLDGTPDNPEMVLNSEQTKDLKETVVALGQKDKKHLITQIPALERLRESVPKLKKFKTGGLADFTGPAWLDGTPSKPEYILNSE
jgi:hypothetical protein